MKFAYDFLVARKLLCLSGLPSVEPTIMPSRTFHKRGSPSQPSRFFPLNSGLKPSLAKAPAGQPVLLKIDLTELPAFPSYRVAIVNAAGKSVWQAEVISQSGEITQPLSKGLGAGHYYVRLYSPAGALLREFSLRAG